MEGIHIDFEAIYEWRHPSNCICPECEEDDFYRQLSSLGNCLTCGARLGMDDYSGICLDCDALMGGVDE